MGKWRESTLEEKLYFFFPGATGVKIGNSTFNVEVTFTNVTFSFKNILGEVRTMRHGRRLEGFIESENQ